MRNCHGTFFGTLEGNIFINQTLPSHHTTLVCNNNTCACLAVEHLAESWMPVMLLMDWFCACGALRQLLRCLRLRHASGLHRTRLSDCLIVLSCWGNDVMLLFCIVASHSFFIFCFIMNCGETFVY